MTQGKASNVILDPKTCQSCSPGHCDDESCLVEELEYLDDFSLKERGAFVLISHVTELLGEYLMWLLAVRLILVLDTNLFPEDPRSKLAESSETRPRPEVKVQYFAILLRM